MQCAPYGDGGGTGAPHEIIFLKPCNGIAYVWGKYTIDGTAVITQPAQLRLHGTDISRLHNELFAGLEVVTPSPLVAWRKIGGVQTLPLMNKSPLVTLCQW